MLFLDKTFEVKVTRDVAFGRAIIHATTQPVERDLLLDIYEPVGRPVGTLAPALVLAFGGAFHRGSKEDDGFEHEGSRSTAMAQYCHEFARRGYVCFSIGYRLMQEDPDPGNTVAMSDPQSVPRSRVDTVRNMLGLPPADNMMLWRGIEGAIDDGTAALGWVQDNAQRLGIDPERVAAGGWSAGARVFMHAVFVEGAKAAAVVCVSGYMDKHDMARAITSARQQPVFFTWGTKDLDYVLGQGPRFRDHFSAIGLPHVAHEIPGVNHFYPSSTPVSDGRGGSITLEESMAQFLYESLGLRALQDKQS